MQGIQNIPPPDTNSTDRDNDFGNHSAIDPNLDNEDIENPNESIPLPPDQQPPAPIEEPPDKDGFPVREDNRHPEQIV